MPGKNEKTMLTSSSSSSVVTLVLFGMLFAWLLATAAMTYRAGVSRRRIPGASEYAVPSATATDEASKPLTEESAPFPLSRGRRVDQPVGPEKAPIAASVDSR